jgi:hypothetical protein
MSFIIPFVSGVFVSVTLNVLHEYTLKKEYFGTLPNRTVKVNREMMTDSNTAYAVNGNYQASLSPRFINTNVGANIRYNLPPSDMMASPSHPTTMRERLPNEVRPRIAQPPQSNSRMSTGVSRPVSHSAPRSAPRSVPVANYPQRQQSPRQQPLHQQQAAQRPQQFQQPQHFQRQSSAHNGQRIMNERHINMDSAATSHQVNNVRNTQRQYLNVQDVLPVTQTEMVKGTMNMQGSELVSKIDEQPIIYDRFMFANSKSNLRGQSDPFRGDLPIVPILPQSAADSGVWFRPSVTPHIDLGRGYLSVAGGFDNDSNNKLKELMIASSGGTLQTFGGDNVRMQRSIINNSSGDLMVSAFV